ncbi:MAG: efflux RND transporter permease subunit [Thermodesulfobacteriota bacterium]
MDRYIQFVLKRPVGVLLFFIAITVALSFGIAKLQFDTSISKFLPETDPAYKYYQQVKETYGDIDTFVILAVSDKNLWSHQTFQDLNALLNDLQAYATYHPEVEKQRLAKLDTILDKKRLTRQGLLSAFGDDAVFQRLLERKMQAAAVNGNALTGGDKRKLKDAVETAARLKEQELIDDIVSPLNVEDVTGANDTLSTVELIETDSRGRRILPETRAEFAAFKHKLHRNPAFENGIYTTDHKGEITDLGFALRLTDMSNSDAIAGEILEITDAHQTKLDILAQGQPLVYVWINQYMQNDLARFVPLVLLVAICIFLINFRSFRGVILPATTLMMATSWILGLMGHLGVEITTVGISIPILMIAVGSSYGIHILNQYYADFDYITRKGKIEGLRHSMNHISITVLLTGLTTFVAFLTLTTHQLSAIRNWGLFSAIGVIFAVWISASIIPAGLALMSHKKDRYLLQRQNGGRSRWIDTTVRGASHVAIHYYKPLLLGVAVMTALSVAGLFRLNVETELLSFFKPDNPIRTSAVEISEKFGGRWGFSIIIDSKEPDGVKNPKYLKTIADFRKWLTAEENADLHIGRTDAFNDYIKTMHMAMHNDDPAYFRIPENKWDVWDYLEIFSAEDANSDGRADIFEPYVDPAFQKCNILARLCDEKNSLLGTSGVKHTFNRIKAHLNQTLPADYDFKITGHPAMVLKSADYIVYGQIQSLLLTLLVIGIVVVILLRDLRAGMLALIPMGVGVVFNFGIMGWFGIQLDVATSLIAAITIGIGVDDTIHFLNTFRYYRKRGFNVDMAIFKTECVAGKAIIFTSLALIFGFSVLGISTFKPLILFGLLMAITMVATTFGALLVLPAAIKFSRIQLVKSPAKTDKKSWQLPGSALKIAKSTKKA